MAELQTEENYRVSCRKEGQNVTVMHVKLTETALRALESYQGCKVRGGGRGVLRVYSGGQGVVVVVVVGCLRGGSSVRASPRRTPHAPSRSAAPVGSLPQHPRWRVCRCRGRNTGTPRTPLTGTGRDPPGRSGVPTRAPWAPREAAVPAEDGVRSGGWKLERVGVFSAL